jgi:hypothetical protein
MCDVLACGCVVLQFEQLLLSLDSKIFAAKIYETYGHSHTTICTLLLCV